MNFVGEKKIARGEILKIGSVLSSVKENFKSDFFYLSYWLTPRILKSWV